MVKSDMPCSENLNSMEDSLSQWEKTFALVKTYFIGDTVDLSFKWMDGWTNGTSAGRSVLRARAQKESTDCLKD